MAEAFLQDSQLRFVFEAGLDGDGNMKFKNKNYNNVKTTATADQLLAVAQAIVGLQTLPLVSTERNDTHLITE